MGRRTIIEAVYLVAGLLVTLIVFRLGAWAYPFGRAVVAQVGWGTMVVVLMMGIGPLRDAWRADQADRPVAGDGARD